MGNNPHRERSPERGTVFGQGELVAFERSGGLRLEEGGEVVEVASRFDALT
jgi:hypothetical protein